MPLGNCNCHFLMVQYLILDKKKTAKKGNVLTEEQRVYCKICTKLGILSKEIEANMDTVYGDKAQAYSTVTKWLLLLKNKGTGLKDA